MTNWKAAAPLFVTLFATACDHAVGPTEERPLLEADDALALNVALDHVAMNVLPFIDQQGSVGELSAALEELSQSLASAPESELARLLDRADAALVGVRAGTLVDDVGLGVFEITLLAVREDAGLEAGGPGE